MSQDEARALLEDTHRTRGYTLEMQPLGLGGAAALPGIPRATWISEIT